MLILTACRLVCFSINAFSDLAFRFSSAFTSIGMILPWYCAMKSTSSLESSLL